MSYQLVNTLINAGREFNITSLAEVHAATVGYNQDLSIPILLFEDATIFANVSPVDVGVNHITDQIQYPAEQF
jgi:hypothetical protein